MLLREYEDRWGMKAELNLEAITAVVPECSREEWEAEDLDIEKYGNTPVTVHFGGLAFGTTRKVYLEMLDELAKQDCECRCNSQPVDATERMPMGYIKHQIMRADYMSADVKIRLLADLDIVF